MNRAFTIAKLHNTTEKKPSPKSFCRQKVGFEPYSKDFAEEQKRRKQKLSFEIPEISSIFA